MWLYEAETPLDDIIIVPTVKVYGLTTRPRGYKTFSSMKFFLLLNVKMPTIVGILTFMSRKNSILSLSEPEKCRIS